jgi:transcriptional regulator with XRE-family HTH domain
VDVCLVIKERLEALGLDQRDLAAAAEVTESYISQLLTRKKLPPAPDRTDIYEKMGGFLKLSSGKLAKLANLQRREELKKDFEDPPAPLFAEVRELILRKCAREKRQQIRAIFEKQTFGELERLVTQTLLDVCKRVARAELQSENWLRLVARRSGRSYKQMRVIILEFLDTDILQLSPENCVAFLDPLVEWWEIDLPTFELEIALNPKLSSGAPRKFRFAEQLVAEGGTQERGFAEFLKDRSLSGSATPEEIESLGALRFTIGRPTALYYYRELQSLRDPLHFRPQR